MDEKEELILNVVSNIEVQLWIHQDLNNPKSEKFWLSQYVSKEPQFYEKVLQAFKNDRRYIVLSKLIEVYELDNKKCISHDKLFRMDYKPVYEFLLKYQQDIKSIGKEKSAAITDSHPQIQVTKPAKRLKLIPKQRDELNIKIVEWVEKFISDRKGSQEESFEKLAAKSEKVLKHKLTEGQIRGRFNRTHKTI